MHWELAQQQMAAVSINKRFIPVAHDICHWNRWQRSLSTSVLSRWHAIFASETDGSGLYQQAFYPGGTRYLPVKLTQSQHTERSHISMFPQASLPNILLFYSIILKIRKLHLIQTIFVNQPCQTHHEIYRYT